VFTLPAITAYFIALCCFYGLFTFIIQISDAISNRYFMPKDKVYPVIGNGKSEEFKNSNDVFSKTAPEQVVADQMELIQNDIDCILDGYDDDDETLTNVCQVIVDRLTIIRQAIESEDIGNDARLLRMLEVILDDDEGINYDGYLRMQSFIDGLPKHRFNRLCHLISDTRWSDGRVYLPKGYSKRYDENANENANEIVNE
jgi:hypothetical protein